MSIPGIITLVALVLFAITVGRYVGYDTRRAKAERKRLERLHEESYQQARTCQCGRPAVVRVRCPFETPYQPWFGYCEEHRGMPLTQGWQLTEQGWEPSPVDDMSMTNLDGSPAEHVYGIEELIR